MHSPIAVVLPVYNEAEAIGGVLNQVCSIMNTDPIAAKVGWRIIVSEDGSKDGTRAEVAQVAHTWPGHIHLLEESPQRLGYSRAMIRGMISAKVDEVVVTMDSDGQCDPADIMPLASLVENDTIVVGFRDPRQDSYKRILYSKLFGFVYRRFFSVRLRDPSCPMIAIARANITPEIMMNPRLNFGYWWEFQARIHSAGLTVKERSVTHLNREVGNTKVYATKHLPKIVTSHLMGLWLLKRDLKDL